jgi:hypothetical protein
MNMDAPYKLFKESARVIGVIRTHGGDHEPAAVKKLSEAYEKAGVSYLIIRRQNRDGCYEPLSEDARAGLSDAPLSLQRNYKLRAVTCPQVYQPVEAKRLLGAQTVEEWTESTIEDLEEYREQLPEHVLILTLGEDNGINDFEFQAALQLCDAVVLTAYEIDEHYRRTASNWLEIASPKDREKIIFALLTNQLRDWSVKFLSAEDLNANEPDEDDF